MALSGTWSQIYQSVAYYLGFGRPSTPPLSDSLQDAEITEILRSGYRLYLNPPSPTPGQPAHKWSFLRVIAGGPGSLPGDFAGVIGNAYSSHGIATRVSYEEVAAYQARGGNASGPSYYAITANADNPPTYTVAVYGDSITFLYQRNPEFDTGSEPVGGATHAELLEQACLSVAESRMDDSAGTSEHHQRFMALLSEAIGIDSQVDRVDGKSYPDANSATTLAFTYYDFIKEIGGYLKFGYNRLVWTGEQAGVSESILKRAQIEFYNPIPPGDKSAPHQWSFLQPKTTLSLASGTVALPADFGGMVGDVVNTADGHVLSQISPRDMHSLQGSGAGTGTAKYYSVEPKTTDGTASQGWQLMSYPTATTSTVNYSYQVLPAALSTTAQYPYGTAVHAEVLMECCLAKAEEYENAGKTEHLTRYRLLLAQAIERDKVVVKVDERPWPIANNSTNLDQTYYDLLRELGGYLDFGYNSQVWTSVQAGIVDATLQSGCRMYYWPQLANQPPYQWTFLQPSTTLAVVAGENIFTLPADFGSLVGDITWPTDSGTDRKIKVISEFSLREKLQQNPVSTGFPRYAAIEIESSGGSTGYRIRFSAKFDQNYNLGYTYRIIPQALSATNPTVLGGKVHAETVRAACLCAAELRKTGKHGGMYENFVGQLKASIENDSQLHPNHLGTYFDRSHRRRFYGHTSVGIPTLLYNGSVI